MNARAAMRGESENPFRLAHWLGQVDPRPPALFRIGLGCSLLHDLLDYARDFSAFLTDHGAVTRSIRGDAIFKSLQLSGFVRPLGAVLAGYPVLCSVLTRAVLFLEATFPLYAFSPFAVGWARAAAIAADVMVQGGILLTLRVGIFTEV